MKKNYFGHYLTLNVDYLTEAIHNSEIGRTATNLSINDYIGKWFRNSIDRKFAKKHQVLRGPNEPTHAIVQPPPHPIAVVTERTQDRQIPEGVNQDGNSTKN
jgi:hypothetical protein